MRKIALTVIVLVSLVFNSKAQEHPNILIGLNGMADGVKIKANWPNYTGGWARGFSIANEDASEQYFKFGVNGNATNGVTRINYGFIGKNYSDMYMVFRPNGNVGIGEADPETKLQISSSKTGVSEGIRLHDNGSGSNEGLWIQFSQANMSDMARIGAKSEDVSRGSLKFYTKDTNDGESIERMTIAPNGNIGIGTTNPEGNLQIGSGTQNGMLFLGGGKGYAGIGSARSDGGLIMGWNIYTRYNGADDDGVARVGKDYGGLDGYSGVKFGQKGIIDFFGHSGDVVVDEVANTNERIKMRISETGDICIGTLSTSDSTGPYKLSVNGKVRANEVKVYTGWADFVFEKDYNLPTLEEVENHINTKGHLKDIPNAKEVEENGIYLGEMNSKLLQKIEELTLYTIQQEKRINSLENRKNKLEEENKELKSISKRLSQLEKLIKG